MELSRSFHHHFSGSPTLMARAPGRVNLLGEHVDYNNGPVLPAAIDRAVQIAAAPSGDRMVSLSAIDLNSEVIFRLESLEGKTDVEGRRLPGWALYPAGVAWSLQSAGFALSGMRAVYTADIPIGAGLSSSAAVEVAFAVAWQALSDWQTDRMTLARLCQRAEVEYVGVNSGLMDQFTSAHGVAGHVLYFDTRDLSWEAVPLPPDAAIVIADSGVRRSLTESAYNERHAACEQAVERLRQYLPDIQSLRDLSPSEFAAYSEFLPETIRMCAEHVVKEIARVESALIALRRGESHHFGALMFAGHASLRDLYQVSIPQLDALVDIARGLPGCYGARLTGAGFGGCTVNLVNESQAEAFIAGLQESYQQQTGCSAQVYLCRASQGASVESL